MMDQRKFVMPFLVMAILSMTGFLHVSGGRAPHQEPGQDPGIPWVDDLHDPGLAYPVWTFVHVRDRSLIDSISPEVTACGGEIRTIYDIVPVISVLFRSPDEVEMTSAIDGIIGIERQRSVRILMDTSTATIKANPSSEYSPRTARELGMTGSGVTIAVIDTGVDNEHPTFQGAFAAGLDLTAPINTPLNPSDGTFDPDDRTGHGTGVASIALGRGDQQGDHRGVAPGAGLIDIKVVGQSGITLNQNSLLDALQWCSDNRDTVWGDTGYQGVDIVSMSLGIGDGAVAVSQALDELVGQGIVVVQGSGNSGGSYESGPGTTWADRSIVVGAIDDQDTVDRTDDEIWSSSTYGPRTDDGDNNPYDEMRPDVVAPGVGITVASSSRTSRIQGANGWSSGSGTSFATPHVSGTVALMLQAKSSLAPDGQGNHISRILHQTSEARGEPYDAALSPTYSTRYGFGIIDSYEAVKTSLTYVPVNHRPEITYFSVEPNVTTAGSTCRVRAVATDLDEEALTYSLSVDDGTLTGDGPLWDWKAPSEPGKYYFNLVVSDPSGGKDTASTFVIVEEGLPNRPPVITSFKAGKTVLPVGGTTNLRVVAIDQDGDELEYDYDAERGSVQGSGDEVIYEAPSQPVLDRVTVTVLDGKGGTDSRSLEIEVREETVNSPPVIRLATVEPGVINSNNSADRVVLYAQVEDPDGLEDIEIVIADLRSIGGGSGIEMLNDGMDPDVAEGDLEFTLELPSVADLENGTYSLQVTVYDYAGGTDSTSVQLIVDIPSSSTEVRGSRAGMSMTLIIFVIILVLLVVLALSGYIIARSRSRSKEQPQPQTRYPVQYPYGGNPGMQQTAQRYSPVGRR
ncbi:MAG: S8 family serine peptidase [Thermoplasmatota archaeon]